MLIFKQIDKANHFIVGTLMYCFFAIILGPILSIILVSIVATFKELFDDKFDFIDLLCTIAGALPAFILNSLT
jgi:hypothetical protein